MSLADLARLIRRTGRIAEPAPPAPDRATPTEEPPTAPPRALRGSAQIRHVDAGSCNGCEIEVAAAFGPVYDAERYGARLVASPRHADVVLVTGVVTRNMAEPLRLTVEATPQPRWSSPSATAPATAASSRGAYGVVGAVARRRPRRPRGARLPARAGGDRRGAAAGDGAMTGTSAMTAIEASLLAQGVLAAVALLAAVAAPARRRNLLAGTACAALAAAGATTGALALAGHTGAVRIPTALPLPPLVLAPDSLGGLFVLLVGAVGVLASIYAIGYAHGASATRTQWAALAVFLLGMQTVPAAADVVSFLLAWELMAVASTVLVLAEQARNREARARGRLVRGR